MEYYLLTQITRELDAALRGAQVHRAFGTSSGAVCLLLRRVRRNLILLIDPDRTMPRMHLASAKPPAGDASSPFVLFLRSKLSGARVDSVRIVNGDRIVDLSLSTRDAGYRFIFEATGASANLILTDQDGVILAVLRPLPPEQGRSLSPGVVYRPPDKRAFSGHQHRDGRSVIAPAGDAEFPVNRGVETYFDGLTQEREISALRQRLLSMFKKGLAKVERRVAALERDLREMDRAQEYREAGELLLANLAKVGRGADAVVLTGHDGTARTIPLDPRLSPARNAESCFKRYKKAKAGQEIVRSRLGQSRGEAAELRRLMEQAESAGDLKSLGDLDPGLPARERGSADRKKGSTGRGASLPPGIRRILFQGWEILVGRSAAGNDSLTTKIARPEDLWLHAEGLPGSHVLVRNPSRREIPPGVLTRAASLAAYHSKGKEAGKVEVLYTRAKHVRKPKGAKPGSVVVSERKTIVAVPAPE